MTLPSTSLRVRAEAWDLQESAPSMGDDRFHVTDRGAYRDGLPVIPVTGELHFTRVPRREWGNRLRLMRAGGITAVSTYAIWLHHQPEPGPARFDGGLDLAAFVSMAEAADLDVVLRIGPWCHGEVRNGGFPDWVRDSTTDTRTNDPAYLQLVEEWFDALGSHLAAVFARPNRVVAIQLENELYDQPDHVASLRRIAARHGLHAPVYTATAWGGAALPKGDVLPVYGGYADGFWVDAGAGWDITFRDHFFHSQIWDDPGIGADLRSGDVTSSGGRLYPDLFPPATCELGGGMAVAYHRRPLVTGLDVAAVAHTKIGNGSAWQGYYMYAGGLNPAGTRWQESHDTGYPNDLPRFDYDFNAPIGSAGELNSAYALLREQHTFLRDFGAQISHLRSVLPECVPADVHDRSTLRWALRSDGRTGVMFLTWHQPFETLADVRDVRFEVELHDETIRFPDRPLTIPAGTIARWPVNLSVGGVEVRWATASLIACTEEGVPLLVLGEEQGVAGEVRFADGVVVTDEAITTDDMTSGCRLLRARTATGAVDVLIVPHRLRGLLTVTPLGRVILSGGAVSEDGDTLAMSEGDGTEPVEFDRNCWQWQRIGSIERAGRSLRVTSIQVQQAGPPKPTYGAFAGRASAPTADDLEGLSARWMLDLSEAAEGDRLTMSWSGDVALLLIDGRPVADQFWTGRPWRVSVDALGAGPGAKVELWILAGHPDSAVGIGYGGHELRLPVVAELLEATLVAAPRWNLASPTVTGERSETHRALELCEPKAGMPEAK